MERVKLQEKEKEKRVRLIFTDIIYSEEELEAMYPEDRPISLWLVISQLKGTKKERRNHGK